MRTATPEAMAIVKAPFTVPRALARTFRRNTIRGS